MVSARLVKPLLGLIEHFLLHDGAKSRKWTVDSIFRADFQRLRVNKSVVQRRGCKEPITSEVD